jgi:uncharacterized protein (TIGR01777 family)
MVGTALGKSLTEAGHEVIRLVRTTPTLTREVHWQPTAGHLDWRGLHHLDAVVHLAGENVGSGYWTQAKKRRILDSRQKGTRLLAEALARRDFPPKVFLSASAVGIYGSRGNEELDEGSSSGGGFLAEVCRRWEAACEPLRELPTRIVRARMGVILSPLGGALEKMLIPFRFGLGGVVGSGEQVLSWITLRDTVRALEFLIHQEVSGPVNVVAPQPVTNREFTHALGKVLRRPTWIPLPAFAARMVFGEMGRELLLGGQRVRPGVLLERGFTFAQSEIEGALREVLGG